MFYVIEFIIVFILIYLYYKFMAKKRNKKKRKKDFPVEVNFFITYKKPDMKKLKYEDLYKKISLVNAFDVALVVVSLELVSNIFLKVFMGVILIILTIFVSYNLLGIYYKKKGMIKDV